MSIMTLVSVMSMVYCQLLALMIVISMEYGLEPVMSLVSVALVALVAMMWIVPLLSLMTLMRVEPMVSFMTGPFRVR